MLLFVSFKHIRLIAENQYNYVWNLLLCLQDEKTSGLKLNQNRKGKHKEIDVQYDACFSLEILIHMLLIIWYTQSITTEKFSSFRQHASDKEICMQWITYSWNWNKKYQETYSLSHTHTYTYTNKASEKMQC